MTFRRPISPNERIYFAGARISPPFAINFVVDGDGRVDPRALADASTRAAAACPGARLVARGAEWHDSGAAPPVRTIARDALDLDSAALRAPLDPARGPCCEIVLASGPRSSIIFRAFHGVMDGKGVLCWARAVLAALRGEPPAPAPSRETDAELAAKLAPNALRDKLAFASRSPLGDVRADDAAFFWKKRAIPGNHPALVAKLAAVLAAEGQDERARFMVPVDLRRHDAAIASTGNLSLPIFLDAARGEAWGTIHARLIDALAKNAEVARDGREGFVQRTPVWALASMIGLAIKRQSKTQKYMASGVLSHLGRVDLRDFAAPGFEPSTAYSLPVHAPLAPLSVAIVEHAAHVEIAIACPAGESIPERADALLDRIERALAPHARERWAGNETAAPFPRDASFASLFRRQAAETPDAVAVVRGDIAWTYAELDARSDAIARALVRRGAKRGDAVGLLVRRNEHAVAAILGALKAGVAYVPIDPAHPDARISATLDDARAILCLTERALAERAAPHGETLEVDAVSPSDDDAHVAGPSATDLAYVLYTSGSTGRPKGVEVEHRALVHYACWAKHAYGIDARTRFAVFTSLAFDLTVTSLLVPLVAGGSVAMIEEDVDAVSLSHALHDAGANALKITPTHLDLIARLGLSARGYRLIVIGGEQLTTAVAARAQTAFGESCAIVNEYGPTEATVGCVAHRFDARAGEGRANVPIGLPATNTRIVLLDAARRPVAVGDTGEIWICGECLARGYRGRDDLTRERFVRLADGTRAYRTGDLARVDESGVLEYLGRADDQIKIRGHRIEPAEIERALEAHPSVERAVVIARPRPGGDEKALCAYVVARGAVEDTALRTFAAARLPPAMVPAFVTFVDELPRTVNGKIDARALPDPFATRAAAPKVRAARDATERAISAIWGAVLRVDPDAIATDADFHDLGGDSLAMLTMLAAVARDVVGAAHADAFMKRTRAIVKSATIASVSLAVEEARRAEEAA